jgi:signal transduction histidine kinase
MSGTQVRILPVTRSGLFARLQSYWIAAVHVLCFGPALALLILVLVGWALSPIAVGLLLVHPTVPLIERLARLHRSIAGRALSREIIVVYLTPDPARSRWSRVWARPWVWLQDPARWRDVVFLAFASSAGFALSIAVFALPAATVADIGLAAITGNLWWLALLVPDITLWWVLTPYLALARLRSEELIFAGSTIRQLEERVAAVTASRSQTLDHSSAEIRRIERDLHDGAQARIVSLGMQLGLAEVLIRDDPEAAADLLAQARQATTSALEDLRAVVRSVHPPVLADRGLEGAVQALAMQLAVPVMLRAELPDPIPAPIETAVYFAVAEGLANIVKHASASHAWVTMRHHDDRLMIEIGDDGSGGARPKGIEDIGSGLAGVVRRLQAFDGIMTLNSPTGGPTIMTLEVPCVSSSPRTSPS